MRSYDEDKFKQARTAVQTAVDADTAQWAADAQIAPSLSRRNALRSATTALLAACQAFTNRFHDDVRKATIDEVDIARWHDARVACTSAMTSSSSAPTV